MPRITQATQVRQLDELIASGLAKKLRIDAGDTLAVAGRAVEVDPAAVLKWERGERRPRGRNVRAYLRYLRRLEATQQASTRGDAA